MRRLSMCVLALGLMAPVLQAQTVSVSAGERVRIRTSQPALNQVFIFREQAGDTVVLQRVDAGTTMRVPFATIDRFQVSQGYRSTGSRMLRGAGWGLVIGAVTGTAAGLISGDDEHTFLAFTATEKATIAAVVFGGYGAVLGSVIGLLRNPERWQDARLPPQVAVTSTAGGRIEIAYHLTL